jgi:hypothetical protein
MKTIKLLAIFLSVFIISCGKDEDNGGNNNCANEKVTKIILENEVEFLVRYNADEISRLVYFEEGDSLEIKINYDIRNNIISIYDYFNDNIDSFVYNSTNRITQSITYNIEGGTKKFESKATYTYNLDGKLTSLRDSIKEQDNESVFRISQQSYKYNTIGDYYTGIEVAQFLEDGTYDNWYTSYDTTFYSNTNNPIKTDASIKKLIDICRLIFIGDFLDQTKLMSKIKYRDVYPIGSEIPDEFYEDNYTYKFDPKGRLTKYQNTNDETDAFEFIYECK